MAAGGGSGRRTFPERCREANRQALARGYVEALFPEGRRRGREWIAGHIHGGRGRSFGVNLTTGEWNDLAVREHHGHDLVALIAQREGLGQKEALEKLERDLGLSRAAPELPAKPGKDRPPAPSSGPPSRTWIYRDEDGRELYRALRWEQPGHRKSCRSSGVKEAGRRVPLDLPGIIKAAKEGRTVFIVEGEPKVEVLKSWGLAATTFINGAHGYQPEMARYFAGAAVVVLVDADRPGREFGRTVAADLGRAGSRSVKVIELPGARFRGYDLVDWQADGGSLERLTALVREAPEAAAPEPEAGRPFRVRGSDFSGEAYLTRDFKGYDWLIDRSFRRGQLGLICGPPGCGKGIFSLQLTAALAAGRPAFDFWEISRPRRTLYVSAEDDQEVLQHRIGQVLRGYPPDLRREMARRFHAVPVRGRINLCEGERGGLIRPTAHYEDLKNLLTECRPELLILDTLARVFEADENDNPTVTAACGLLEEIIEEYGCNVILVHHSGKSSGDLAADQARLKAALSQTAIRGASALAGCVRWALLMAPLADELAEKVVGPAAAGKPGGSYVAVRVVKKNAGRAEGLCLLERGEHGLLSRVDLAGEEGAAQDGEDARQLAAEVERRRRYNEEPLSVTTGPRNVLAWSDARARRAVARAVGEGLIVKSKKSGGKGWVLTAAAPARAAQGN
ncbi:MAG: AAA family ATPase [Candidatus Adiutrix sp.]|jgi:hypothetical protein|nr:AAA family ATPase [Candidatus Adiutrix sp.]